MATYQFECSKCRKTFTVQMSFTDYDKHGRMRCPKCQSQSVKQLPTTAQVQTTKKS
jgi:putative FmdB family regulatory protein